MEYRYSKTIRMTASGVALSRGTLVSAFTVNAVNADCIVNLRDGGVNGPIRWTLEADNAASSPSIVFDPPIKFDTNIYAEFTDKGSQSTANIAIVEN